MNMNIRIENANSASKTGDSISFQWKLGRRKKTFEKENNPRDREEKTEEDMKLGE